MELAPDLIPDPDACGERVETRRVRYEERATPLISNI